MRVVRVLLGIRAEPRDGVEIKIIRRRVGIGVGPEPRDEVFQATLYLIAMVPREWGCKERQHPEPGYTLELWHASFFDTTHNTHRSTTLQD